MRVSDNHVPAGTTTRSFVVIVERGSGLEIVPAISPQGRCTLNWASQAGVRYRVFYLNALQAGPWQMLADLDGTGAELSFTDSTADGVSSRFYRIEVLP